jgi:hypothetical protein
MMNPFAGNGKTMFGLSPVIPIDVANVVILVFMVSCIVDDEWF